MEIAEELAKKQRAISVAEFFEKNRQILGFDSAPRCLITTVKEGVDNALDACEEAGILPDILVEIEDTDDGYYRITLEDNGPGIVKEQIPKTFAKLLYGSRFHAIKQSRGQQGIGISAAVLYAQLSTGRPTRIISKIGRDKPANLYELVINTGTNEPEIINERETRWDRPRGTRVELEMEGQYIRGRRQSIYEYMKNTAIVNPHARFTLLEPDGNRELFERVTDEMPRRAEEILPHPEGIELGTLMKMLRYTEYSTLTSFLVNSFTRLGRTTAKEICKTAGLGEDLDPRKFGREEARLLINAFKSDDIRVYSPPTDCLSPITEQLIYKGLEKEYSVDFISTTTRSASVYGGHPFLVEAGIAYGGDLPGDSRVKILRFANRVPLLYQQGGCAITHAIESINWRGYELNQPGGTGIPSGPAVVLVHVASTHVPFTSESKDAIADIPEILSEVELAVRDVARDLRRYLSRKKRLSKRREKENVIKKVLPLLAEKVSEIVEEEPPDITPVVAKIMGNVLIDREVKQNKRTSTVTLSVENYSDVNQEFKLHDIIPYRAQDISPEANRLELGERYDLVWPLKLGPGDRERLRYRVRDLEPEFDRPVVEGIEEELVSGARVLRRK